MKLNPACFLAAHVKRGDELIAHGRNQAARQIEMPLEEEREMIREVTATITRRSGMRPAGWMSPYLTPSANTSELIAQAAYAYCMDWGICDRVFGTLFNLSGDS